MNQRLDEVSVLLPVYGGYTPEFARSALASVLSQTQHIAEIVIIIDGPIPNDLEQVVSEAQTACPKVRLLRLPENCGLGRALNLGVQAAEGPLVARMDADDLAVPDRIRIQRNFLASHPDVAVVGGQIEEFVRQPGDTRIIRSVPQTQDDIRRYASRRNPMNHMTVMFRKSAVIAAGNYQEWPGFEDYHLWAVLLSKGYIMANLPQIMVFARTDGLSDRRGGLAYVRTELRLRKELLRLGVSSPIHYAISLATSIPVWLLPPSLRTKLYKTFLRSRLAPSVRRKGDYTP